MLDLWESPGPAQSNKSQRGVGDSVVALLTAAPLKDGKLVIVRLHQPNRIKVTGSHCGLMNGLGGGVVVGQLLKGHCEHSLWRIKKKKKKRDIQDKNLWRQNDHNNGENGMWLSFKQNCPISRRCVDVRVAPMSLGASQGSVCLHFYIFFQNLLPFVDWTSHQSTRESQKNLPLAAASRLRSGKSSEHQRRSWWGSNAGVRTPGWVERCHDCDAWGLDEHK